MIALGAELLAAQDEILRHPLVEIISESPIPDIPFLGSLLTGETTDETGTVVETTSDGRLVLVYIFGAGIRYAYTDVDRTFYTHVDLSTFDPVLSVSLCVMADGNIGVVYLAGVAGGTNYIRSQVLSPTGSVITGETTIETLATSYVYGGDVILLASGTYLFVYGYRTGATYYLRKKTSSDFSTWSASSNLSISGVGTSYRAANPDLIQISSGEVFLWFELVEVTSGVQERANIYRSISANDGGTWGAATAETIYSDYTASGLAPSAAQKSSGTMTVGYTEHRQALVLDGSEPGWPPSVGARADNVHIDQTTRKLYVVSHENVYGRAFVVQVDIDTWTVDGYWDNATIPAFSTYIAGIRGNNFGDGQYIPLIGTSNRVAVLDASADTIIELNFGAGGNVTGAGFIGSYGPSCMGAMVSASERRLYLHWAHGTAIGSNGHSIGGYIDLNAPGPTYAWNQLWDVNASLSQENFYGMGVWPGGFYWSVADDLFIFSSWNATSTWKSRMVVIKPSTGTILKNYIIDTHASFPWRGCRAVWQKNGVIYGSVVYDGTNDPTHKGVIAITIATDAMTYLTPPYGSYDDYLIYNFVETDDGKLICPSYYGTAIYTVSTGTWELISNATRPGLHPFTVIDPSSDAVFCVAYDYTEKMVVVGDILYSGDGWGGTLYFSLLGPLNILKYFEGSGSGSSWTFPNTFLSLVQGNFNLEPALVKDPSAAAIYAFWTSEDALAYSTKWGKDGSELNVSGLIVKGSEVSIKRSIDGSPNKITFAVSHGHLFDPNNLASLWNPYFQKGRRIAVRWGENVGGTPYWQNAGKFLVMETKVRYGLSDYPTMEVIGEDRRTWWRDGDIVTEHYTATPEAILADLLDTFGGFAPVDISIPAMAGSYQVWHQWVEKNLKDTIEDLLNRFGYFLKVTVDDTVTLGKVDVAKATDHAYSDLTKVTEFTPDDSFSDFTNRVVVVGESRGFIEVTFDEEQIKTLFGTTGWWGGRKTVTVWFSEDKTRRCRDPRLEVIQSIKEFGFRLGGGGESITEVNDLYCVITIEVPNLVGALLAILGVIIIAAASMGASSWNPASGSASGYALGAAIVAAFMIVASVATYQYAVWAKPLGEERQSFQAEANDYDMQTKISRVVTKKIEDPLCIDLSQCQSVANYEMSIIQAQRKRLKLTKVAHLQDEEGDAIEVKHPYGGQTMKIFATDLTRKMVLGESFLDEIEGWRG